MANIVILGAGLGGLPMAFEAREQMRKSDTVTVISDSATFHFTPSNPWVAVGWREAEQIKIELAPLLKKRGIEFIHSAASKVHPERNEVALSNGDSVAYDYLIIASGAKTHFFSFIKGLRENSYGVKNLQRAHNFRVEFEDLIYKKLRHEEVYKNGALNIAIGGAGLSGVEVAAEMAYVLETYSKTIGDTAKEIHIYLIDASDTILPGMGEYSIEKTKKRLQALGVKILTGAFINSVDESHIYFKNGDKLQYHFMIFTGGSAIETGTRFAAGQASRSPP